MAKGITFVRQGWTWCLAALGLASAPIGLQAQQITPNQVQGTKNSVSSTQSAMFVEVAPQDSVLPAGTQGKPPKID